VRPGARAGAAAAVLLAAAAPTAAGPAPQDEGGRLARGVRRVLPAAVDRRLGELASPGPLAAAHAELRGITRCGSCHTALAGTADGDCLACHEKVAERTASGRGVHGGFTGPCGGCHADHLGAEHDLLGLDREAFNHDRALFALHGAHVEVTCDGCHVRPHPETGADRFTALDVPHAGCADCHADPHGETLRRERDCGACHTAAAWSARGLVAPGPAGFDHDADTRFALDALHAALACGACHLEDVDDVDDAGDAGDVGDAGEGVGEGDVGGGDGADDGSGKRDGTGEGGAAQARVASDARPPLPPRDCAGCHPDARALLDGRFGGRNAAPDPHRELACAECHPAALAPRRTVDYGAVCRGCHAGAYARLLLEQRRVLDEAVVAAEDRLRRRERASRRGDAVAPGELARWRDALARLADSGLHHPELAEAVVRWLGRDDGAP